VQIHRDLPCPRFDLQGGQREAAQVQIRLPRAHRDGHLCPHVFVETQVPLVAIVVRIPQRGTTLELGLPDGEQAVAVLDLWLELGDVIREIGLQ